MEPFPMLITELTKVQCKEIQVGMEKFNLNGHIASQCLIGLQQVVYQISVSHKIHTNTF